MLQTQDISSSAETTTVEGFLHGYDQGSVFAVVVAVAAAGVAVAVAAQAAGAAEFSRWS